MLGDRDLEAAAEFYEGALALPLGARAVALERTVASPRTVRRLRAAGVVVCAWTVNAPQEARDLRAIDVGVLITDAPSVVIEALAGPGQSQST